MYDQIMEIAYPKGSKLALNIMNSLKNKATLNLKLLRTIIDFNWLFGLHDCIFEKKYKCTNYLVFWGNGSFDLQNIIVLLTTREKRLQIMEERTFNRFESMYPMYIRIEAENSLTAAFQFGKYQKSQPVWMK